MRRGIETLVKDESNECYDGDHCVHPRHIVTVIELRDESAKAARSIGGSDTLDIQQDDKANR